MMSSRTFAVVAIAAVSLFGCSDQPVEFTELNHYPLDNLDGLVEPAGVEIDHQISSDGGGALKVTASKPMTVRLFEITDPDIDDVRLVYRARLRTEGVTGKVYLELLCHFPGVGEFFSRGLDRPLTGDTEWTTEETLFFLKPGEKPDRVSMNLVVEGTGTAWIDDARLLKGPLSL